MAPTEIITPHEWARACSNAFVPLKVRTASKTFKARLEQNHSKTGISATRVASGSSEVYRSSQIIRDTPRDDLLLAFHITGRGSVHQDGRIAQLQPGIAVLYDTSAPYTLAFPGRMSETIIQFPRRLLSIEGESLRDISARVLPDTKISRALQNLAQAMTSDAERHHDFANDILADSIASLLRSAFEPTVTGAPPLEHHALHALMMRFIEDNSADPSLTPALLASAHNISIRTVHKVFALYNASPAEAIRSTRLERARKMLSRGAPVQFAAAATGFRDVDTFSRAFKRAYDHTPSETVRMRRSAPSTPLNDAIA